MKISSDDIIEYLTVPVIEETITKVYEFCKKKICKVVHPYLKIIWDTEYDSCGCYNFPCFIYIYPVSCINAVINALEPDDTISEIPEIFMRCIIFTIAHELCHSTQDVDYIEKINSYYKGESAYTTIVETDAECRTYQFLFKYSDEILNEFNISISDYNMDYGKTSLSVLRDMTYRRFFSMVIESFVAREFDNYEEYNKSHAFIHYIDECIKDDFTRVILKINNDEIILSDFSSTENTIISDDIVDWLIEHQYYNVKERIIKSINCDEDNQSSDLFTIITIMIELENVEI